MAITFTCACGKQFRFKDEHAGRRVACPSCKQEIDIPLPTSLTQIQLDQDDDLVAAAPSRSVPLFPSSPAANASAAPGFTRGGSSPPNPPSRAKLLLGTTRFFQWTLGIAFVVFWIVHIFVERRPPSADGEWAYQTFLYLLLIFTLECGFSRIVRAIR